jgi:hypothetical protein
MENDKTTDMENLRNASHCPSTGSFKWSIYQKKCDKKLLALLVLQMLNFKVQIDCYFEPRKSSQISNNLYDIFYYLWLPKMATNKLERSKFEFVVVRNARNYLLENFN